VEALERGPTKQLHHRVRHRFTLSGFVVWPIAFRAMDALALTVAALGGGVVATILNEWLRGRREYDEARLLVMAELASMRQIAQNVLDGRLTREWFAAAGLQTAAWETYQVRLVRRLSTNSGMWGNLNGVYATVALFRANPGQGDIAGLQRGFDAAHAALSTLTVRRLWPPKHWFSRGG